MAANTMNQTDWQLNKTLSESNKYLLENEINADVTFRVGENQEAIKAHRLILSCRSPVFDIMLNGRFKETHEDPIITDVDTETFRALLRHCYYDSIDIQIQIAFSTLCAAKKYMLPILKKHSTEVVGANLDTTNALDVYKYSVSTNDVSLRKYCHTYFESNLCTDLIWSVYEYAISVNDENVLESCRNYFKLAAVNVREALVDQAFLKIKHEVLLDFLHINDVVDETEKLYADIAKGIGPHRVKYAHHCGILISEIELFKACNSWAEAECLRQDLETTGINKRTVLGEALFLIRFPTMLNKDMACIVYPTGILTEEETNKVFRFKEVDTDLEIPFPSRQRYALVAVETNSRQVCIEPKERFLLTKIWFKYKGTYKITLKDETTGTGTYSVGTNKPTSYTDSDYIFHLKDIEPVILKAGGKYTLHFESSNTNGTGLQKNTKYIEVGPETLQEVKTTPEGQNRIEYLLTLCLI